MKKIILLFILFSVSCGFGYTQSRLGYTFDQIKSEFTNEGLKVRIEKSEKLKTFLVVEMERADVQYIFDDNKICTVTAIYPHNTGQLNYFVERYNKIYVIISPTKWRAYDETGYADIKLVYVDSIFMLIWTF